MTSSRRLAAIMFTDTVGYTSITRWYEVKAVGVISCGASDLAIQMTRSFKGKVDGIFACF